MLIGISLGPGDPDLLTFKAAKVLKTCKKVFVPGEMAANLARPYCSPEILEFPMIEDPQELERVWTTNARIVAGYALEGQTGFACIGDVNTFSTFSHLRKMVERVNPAIDVQTVPGVGVVPALASRFGAALDRSFLVSDGSELDAVIRIKATRPQEIARELEEEGFGDFTLGTRLCTPEEKVIRGSMPEKSEYFSVLLARRRR
ncbi:MAG: cobalt-factor II C(20)-methyltransferase [Methanotrichaceae archaeon]|nr:cobalt-factor II C(20)-methyltransferase [Methanotrichaceae archaeon]